LSVLGSETLSLYIHIPFCKQKCYYCDFLSFPVEGSKQNQENNKIEEYIDFLVKELSFYKNQKFKTIYIGGGTPSILNESLLIKLLSNLEEYARGLKEYTIEINPESFTRGKFDIISSFGVNRISIGVQSFSDMVLESVNRPTRAKDIFNSIDILKEKKFENFNIDLIVGIQGRNQYLNDLNMAVKLMPSHISLYLLHLSEQAIYYKMYMNGKIDLLDDNTMADLYAISCDYLAKSDYKHYEISNFAKSGYESIHNLNYWLYGDYVGIGLGAVSKIDNRRITNEKMLKKYYEKLSNGELPVENVEYLDRDKQVRERLMLMLRTSRGFEIKEIEDTFKMKNNGRLKNFNKMLEFIIENGYAKVRNGRILLTEKGFLSSNYIISEFFDLLD